MPIAKSNERGRDLRGRFDSLLGTETGQLSRSLRESDKFAEFVLVVQVPRSRDGKSAPITESDDDDEELVEDDYEQFLLEAAFADPPSAVDGADLVAVSTERGTRNAVYSIEGVVCQITSARARQSLSVLGRLGVVDILKEQLGTALALGHDRPATIDIARLARESGTDRDRVSRIQNPSPMSGRPTV